jgi:hypothetical protein
VGLLLRQRAQGQLHLHGAERPQDRRGRDRRRPRARALARPGRGQRHLLPRLFGRTPHLHRRRGAGARVRAGQCRPGADERGRLPPLLRLSPDGHYTDIALWVANPLEVRNVGQQADRSSCPTRARSCARRSCAPTSIFNWREGIVLALLSSPPSSPSPSSPGRRPPACRPTRSARSASSRRSAGRPAM